MTYLNSSRVEAPYSEVVAWTLGTRSIACLPHFYIGVEQLVTIPRTRASVILALSLSASALVSFTRPATAQASRSLDWRLERRWDVGGNPSDSLDLALTRPRSLAVDDRGRLILLDVVNSTVFLLDSTGRRLRSFGRRGQGPGEFLRGASVSVDAERRIVVYDGEGHRWAVFDSSGNVASSRDYSVTHVLQAPRSLSGGAVVSLIPHRDSGRLELLSGIARRRLATLAYPPSRSTPPVCQITDYASPPVFSPTIHFAVRGSRIATTQGTFDISVFDGERQWTLVRAGAERRRASVGDAKRYLGEGVVLRFGGLRPCTVPAEMIIAASGVASTIPAYSGVAIDANGDVWATRFAFRGERAAADVFSVATGYVGTVDLGAARPEAFLSNGDLVSWELDSDQRPIVVVYRVNRTARR